MKRVSTKWLAIMFLAMLCLQQGIIATSMSRDFKVSVAYDGISQDLMTNNSTVGGARRLHADWKEECKKAAKVIGVTAACAAFCARLCPGLFRICLATCTKIINDLLKGKPAVACTNCGETTTDSEIVMIDVPSNCPLPARRRSLLVESPSTCCESVSAPMPVTVEYTCGGSCCGSTCCAPGAACCNGECQDYCTCNPDDACCKSPGACADPEFVGMDGTRYRFDGKKGAVFNLVSEETLQLNSLFDRFTGPDEWPYWGTWMVAFGIQAGSAGSTDALALEVKLNNSAIYELVSLPGTNKMRMVYPGTFSSIIRVRNAGMDLTDWLESGKSLKFANETVTIYFPSKHDKHHGDPTDGPVVVITMPKMEVSIQLETEESLHFDFALRLLPGATITSMHGVLGQTFHWANRHGKAGSTRVTSEQLQGSEMDYEVRDGILGVDWKYNLFKQGSEARMGPGRMLGEVPWVMGHDSKVQCNVLSSAAVVGGSGGRAMLWMSRRHEV